VATRLQPGGAVGAAPGVCACAVAVLPALTAWFSAGSGRSRDCRSRAVLLRKRDQSPATAWRQPLSAGADRGVVWIVRPEAGL